MAKLLGIKVVDLSLFLPGPMLSMMMADQGAEVVKVEPPTGDPAREMEPMEAGQSVWFRNLNGHKQCITLDLKAAKGKDILKRLAKDADVLLENYAPGVMDRLGVGWSVLHELNPRLVYASGSGYGITGPDKDNLAMDVTVQAVSGLMSVSST